MSTEGLVFPVRYKAARPWLFFHGFYGVFGGIAGCLFPEFMFTAMDPLHTIIEKVTGLVSHFQ